jgi:hypothetical protein
MADNVNIIVQDTINDIVVNAAVIVETIDINVQAAVDVVEIIANPNNYVVNINRIIGEQVQSDWDQADDQAPDYIKNKPTIPTATSDLTNDGEDGINPFITAADVTAQVNSDWDATSGVAEILNKPTIPTNTSDLVNDGENGVDPFITAADVPASVTSVGLTMPSAFSVANSPITSSGDIAVTGAGVVSQYVRGDGSLANFPTSTGGGASLSFYLNGSVSQGTIGGVAFREMDRTPILGAGTDFTIAANGYIQSFITDANVPNLLEIPAGNWNFETYFSASSGGGSPSFYVELYKWNGTTLSLIASNSATPEGITNGTAIDLYVSALAVPQTTLLATDRLAIRIYVTHSGRTIKLHTENSHLCQVITTFSTGLTALNGLTTQVQSFATGTSGTDFGISSATSTHTFNLPTASAANRGALSSTDWTTFNGKFTLPALTSGSVLFSNGTTIAQDNANLFWDDTNNRLGIGTTAPAQRLTVIGVASTAPTNSTWISSGSPIGSFYGEGAIGNMDFFIGGASSTASARPVLIGRKSGGTLAVPTALVNGDSVFSFLSSGYSGTQFLNTASINMIVDGVVSTTSVPQAITFETGTTSRAERMRIFSNGNIAINTTTDAGYKLDVNGPVRIQDNFSISSGFSILSLGNNVNLRSNLIGGSGYVVNAQSYNTLNSSSNEQGFGVFTGIYAPTSVSGTPSFNALKLTPTINQTGGANGITRGLYINPTLTAAADFRAIENSVGKVCLNTTSGNTMIGTTTDAGYRLDVNGTARVSGNATFGTLGTGTGMFWDNTNNRLGIGTNAPYSRFTIYGALSTSTSQISIVNSEGGHSIIRSGIAGVNNTGISLITASLDGSSQVTRMVINASGNVLINTTTDVASSKLTIESTTQGFLPPRMTTTQKNAIATPAAGLVVYDSTLGKLCVRGAAAWETITSI